LTVALAALAWAAPLSAEEEEEADPEDVVRFYVEASRLARAGSLRNGAVELRRMTIDESDVAPLAAFLRALDEDYE